MPTAVVEALELHACTHDRHPLLIHISTDQVPAQSTVLPALSSVHLGSTAKYMTPNSS